MLFYKSEIEMKKQEIISVLYELYKITGFRMSLHDVNFVEIAAYPEERLPFCARVHKVRGEYDKCVACDRENFKSVRESHETMIYKCRYGLTEAVSPLYNFGILTGYLMMGQICDTETDITKLKSTLIRLGCSDEESDGILASTTRVSDDMTRSYVKIMTICAQYLTLSNAMPGARPTVAESAKRYIYENIEKRITIKEVCEEVGCSKTTLLSSFKREFGITVNTAIKLSKLEEAKRLLLSGKLNINEIAQATGFYDQSYFSKVFSAEYGMTPSDYRKDMKNEADTHL